MEKRIFEKVMLCVNKGNIAHSSCNIWCTSYRNEIKKVFWMFLFENFIKYEVEGILGIILGKFLLLTYLEWLLLLLSRHYIGSIPFLHGKSY